LYDAVYLTVKNGLGAPFGTFSELLSPRGPGRPSCRLNKPGATSKGWAFLFESVNAEA
jgi:hypothetical protein